MSSSDQYHSLGVTKWSCELFSKPYNKKIMELSAFKKIGQKLNFQKCIYLVSPTPSIELGLFPRWHKLGQTRSSLFSRLRSYLTYWHSLQVHVVAVVDQDPESTIDTLKSVEQYIINCQTPEDRVRRNCESFFRIDPNIVAKQLRRHPGVREVWVAMEQKKH